MYDAYVIQVAGQTAGILARDESGPDYHFFSAGPKFAMLDGRRFDMPTEAERAAREILRYGNVSRVPKAPVDVLVSDGSLTASLETRLG